MLTPEQRAQIARENGAKSKGPVTEEGKSHSRRNAMKHGRRASALALLAPPHTAVHANEDRQNFYRLFDENVATYRPNTDRELAIVRAITDCDWHLHRCAIVESGIYNRELIRAAGAIEHGHPAMADLETTIAAAEALAENKTLKDIRRQIAQLQRRLREHERRLFSLKKHCPSWSMEVASTEADKEANLFEIEDEENQPLAEELQPETATNEPSEPKPEAGPTRINVRGPITPQIVELYRSLFPGRKLELIAYEDTLSAEEEAA